MKKITTIILVCVAITCSSQTSLPLLKISANKRFFQTQDGKPFFWLGDTGWLLFVKLNREEIIQYLDARKAQGFNVIQVMVLHDVKRAVNKYGDSALINQNVETPLLTPGSDFNDAEQYDFWDHVDYVIDEAAKRKMYIALVPVWGSNVKSGWVTQLQARKYASFLAQRYKNKSNIIWLNGGDVNGMDSIEVWNEIGNTIKYIDTTHLISFHPRGRTTSSRWFQKESWLDFNMFQSGHRNYSQDTIIGETQYGEDNWKYVKEDLAKQPLKPTLDGEPSYEGIPQGLHDTTQPYWTDKDVRRYAYWSVLSGSAGFTYGNNAVMQFYQAGDKGSAYGAKKFWQEAIKDKGAVQMQYLQKLVLSKPYFERVNDESMVINNAKRYDRIIAARGKNYAFIYTYRGGKIKLRMGKIEGKKVMASWYNPRTGEYTAEGIYGNTGIKTFRPKGKKEDGNDWVLVLESL